MGSVVLLGRGAGFVPRSRPRLDVRVIAPLDQRVERVAVQRELNRQQAQKICERTDKERGDFVRRLFDADWADPSHYDLVINTAKLDIPTAVTLLETAWRQLIVGSEH